MIFVVMLVPPLPTAAIIITIVIIAVVIGIIIELELFEWRTGRVFVHSSHFSLL